MLRLRRDGGLPHRSSRDRGRVPDVILQRNKAEMQPDAQAHAHDPHDHDADDHGAHDHGAHGRAAHDHAAHGDGSVGAVCRHAREHRHHAVEALERAERICRERGLRLTPIRRRALEALHGDHRPVGAYDLADRISPAGGRRLAPISIYRALDFLVEQGFVHRLSTRNAYVACVHGHRAHEVVAFLICDACGGVDEDSSPAMKQAVAAIAAGRRFAPTHQVVEIIGRCDHCRDAQA